MVGVVLGTGWISSSPGGCCARLGRGAAMLLAGRRLIADPWNGSRTLAALLAGMIAGAVRDRFRELLTTQFRAFGPVQRS